MSTEDAKAYLSQREVPRLFECLMTGLMFHRPNDHIQYLIDSLEKVKQKGQAELTWNMFVEVRSAKTPLPPITPDNGKRPVSRGRMTPKEEPRPITPAAKHSPLPPIGSSGLPNVPVVIIMGGPGSGKAVQANRLAEKHPGWVNIHVGDMLREEMTSKGVEEKWRLVRELVTNGELAPEDVTLELIDECMKNNMEANGYIIQGFPRDMQQAQEFERKMSRLDAVFLLDCQEASLMEKVLARSPSGRLDDSPSALAKRMANFKDKTLPVLKHYDDIGKLYVIDGEQEEEAMHDELAIIFETLLQNLENGRIPSPPTQGKPSSGRRSRKSASPYPAISPSVPLEPDVVINMPDFSYVPPPELKIKDEGRIPGLPQAPIIFVSGGPGSGKGTQCENVTNRYPDIVHLSMGDILRKEISEKGSADEKWAMVTKLLKEGDMAPVDITEELLINCMKEHPDAKAYVVEGYPRDILQYEDFNRHIGGQSFTILLDCDDNYLRKRLVLRGSSGMERIDDNIPAIEKKLSFFARNTLPLLKVIDDEGKLIVIDGDRDEQEIFFDIVKCLDFSLYGLELEEAKTAEPHADDSDDGDADDKSAEHLAEEAAGDDSKDKAEVVEETMTSQNAPVPTGALIDNPSYSAELDALAPAEDDALQEESPRAERDEQEAEEAEVEDEVDKLEEDMMPVVSSRGIDLTRNPDLEEVEAEMVEDDINQNPEEEACNQKDGEGGDDEVDAEDKTPDGDAVGAEAGEGRADQQEEGGAHDGNASGAQDEQEPEAAQNGGAGEGENQQEAEATTAVVDDIAGSVQAESSQPEDVGSPDDNGAADVIQGQNDENPEGSGKADEEKSGYQDEKTEKDEETKPSETTDNSNAEESKPAGEEEGAAQEDNSGGAGEETKAEEGEANAEA